MAGIEIPTSCWEHACPHELGVVGELDALLTGSELVGTLPLA
jgi:hypothetical protein